MIYRFLNGLLFFLASMMILAACAILFAPPLGTGDSRAVADPSGGTRGTEKEENAGTEEVKEEEVTPLATGQRFASDLEMTLFVRRPGSTEYEEVGRTPGSVTLPECDDYYFRLDGLISANAARFAREVQTWNIAKIQSPGNVTSIRLPGNVNDSTLKVFVRDIPELRKLALFQCQQVSDLSSLAERPELTELELIDCPRIADLTPLVHLKSLTMLDMSNCDGPTDFSPLAGMTSLDQLDLSGCDGLTDVSPLSGMTNLTQLDLSSCVQVTDLKPLTGLTRLSSLNLDECANVTDISPLAGLTGLKSLSLYGCGKLEPAQVENLKKQLPGCQIAY